MHLVHPVSWVVTCGALLAVGGLLRREMRRHELSRLGAADLVTLVRATIVCAVAGLVAQSFLAPISTTVLTFLTVLAGLALALDAVDGWLARRMRGATSFGARFDMETDALLILVLSLYVARSLGWWVLLAGAARYLLLAAQLAWPRLRGELPSRRWRKVVAASQGIVLLVATSGLLPQLAATMATGCALALLMVSFGTEVGQRLTGHSWVGPLLSGLALTLVWVALVAPSDTSDGSPWLLLRVPAEGLVLVVVALLLPLRWAARLAVPFGLLAAALLLLKGLNVGFAAVLDRPFHPVGDWRYLSMGLAGLADSVGRPLSILVAVLVAGVALGVLLLVPLATRRVCRLARRHRRRAFGVVAGLTASALVVGGLSATSAALAVEEVRGIRADLVDRTVFAQEIASDAFADPSAHQLLQRLRGKDVLLIFVESYGRSSVEHRSVGPGVDALLDAGTARLTAAGYRSQSAFLTSPTFGAASWLAHATTQAGVWVDSQRRYDQLIGSERLTLTAAFREAGWRTVFDVPANTRDWPQGRAFYGFDMLYDSRNVAYRGPRFGYGNVPDQYTLARFRALELDPAHRRPVMAEIDLVSSHHPWAPLPQLVDWDEVGDGSVFDGMPERGDTMQEVFKDPDRVRQAYGESIEYSLEALVSFLTAYPDDDLVVLMLGDHEPHHYVSGDDPGHDVPVTLVARDPDVVAQIADWGWSPGLRPTTASPVWRMDRLRDRFLGAFSDPIR